jgi:hypothetical protein
VGQAAAAAPAEAGGCGGCPPPAGTTTTQGCQNGWQRGSAQPQAPAARTRNTVGAPARANATPPSCCSGRRCRRRQAASAACHAAATAALRVPAAGLLRLCSRCRCCQRCCCGSAVVQGARPRAAHAACAADSLGCFEHVMDCGHILLHGRLRALRIR